MHLKTKIDMMTKFYKDPKPKKTLEVIRSLPELIQTSNPYPIQFTAPRIYEVGIFKGIAFYFLNSRSRGLNRVGI